MLQPLQLALAQGYGYAPYDLEADVIQGTLTVWSESTTDKRGFRK